jgi:hypothetical protein
MSNSDDPRLSQPLRSRRFSSAADARRVQQLWDGIFAELLPLSTKGPLASASHDLPLVCPAPSAGKKESLPMQAYLTESPYYFSSKQLLPVGSVVFFMEKIRRYVHPTDGVLLDGHPRLHILSEGESQALEARWQEALARY